MVSHPETGSDPPIGSDLESGRDRDSVLEIPDYLRTVRGLIFGTK